ncbi:MAG: hypothetical protein J6V25_04605 [Oscillospiraceae bacterium]|nr:hypothetical protein [Oscillospiraceae bacterium]
MNSCELTAYVTAIANLLASRFTAEELSLISAALIQLGDTLATIAVHQQFCQKEKMCPA